MATVAKIMQSSRLGALASAWITRRSVSTTITAQSRRRNPRDRPVTLRDLSERRLAELKAKGITTEEELPPGITGSGTRPTGFKNALGEWIEVDEMVPELVVPTKEEMSSFTLKAYVSYRANDVDMPEFTARDLFETNYAVEIRDQYARKELDAEADSIVEREKQNKLLQANYEQRPKVMFDTSVDSPV